MELEPYVQEKLLSGHKVNTVVEAGLVEDFIKTTRVVALIEANDPNGSGSLHALLIFETARVPVHSAIDLQLELIIPIDINLKCEIDTSSTDSDSDVLVNFVSGKTRLLFEMPFSQQTNGFVSDVLRAADVLGKRKGGAPEFSWLQSYLQSAKKSPSEDFDNLSGVSKVQLTSAVSAKKSVRGAASNYVVDSSTFFVDKNADVGVDRQSIAMGVSPTPIEARESHIKHLMAQRESTYTDIHNFTVFVGTWNVNGQYPSVGLADWLAVDKEPPDIYAVAFQELDLNTETYLFNTTPKEQEWLNAVINGVHPNAKYAKVRLVRLIGMMLIVLVQEKHLAFINNVAVDTVGTGIMNKLGNKGAVSIRLKIHNTSICFCNAHMAAHVEEFERRNEDHDCIFSRTTFNININGPPKNIRDHDHIYFLGDMNYRINPGNFDVKQLASGEDFKLLLENDQLNLQKAVNRVFHNFHEGDIKFKPTFKYDLGTDNWDSSEKARQPAWCDRILWKGESIEQICYRSHPVLQISDHKPVSALFTAGITVIDPIRHRKVYEEVMKKLDRLENEFLPQAAVDNTEIIIDPIKFLEPQTKYLTVANTGQVPVDFRFIEKLNESSYCKPWLTVRPHISSIKPGEKCDVAFEVVVDKKTAHKLNSGKEKLYDILVLHVVGGKDIFITVQGDYERSCFGSSINALVHMNQPFKEITMSKLIDLESLNPTQFSDSPYAVPKELWYLLDHLQNHGLEEEGLFTQPGLQKELGEIRTALDLGVPDDKLPGSVHSVAEVLLLFLEALPEPVIPFHLYHKSLEATPNFCLCLQIIKELPVYHRNVFEYLMSFLKKLLEHSIENGLDAKTLAHVFGSILIREDETCGSIDDKNLSLAAERKKQTFVHHFLVNNYD